MVTFSLMSFTIHTMATNAVSCPVLKKQIYTPVYVHYVVLVHEGNVVTVEGGIMNYTPETDTTLPECTKTHSAQKLAYKVFSVTHLPETAVGLCNVYTV